MGIEALDGAKVVDDPGYSQVTAAQVAAAQAGNPVPAGLHTVGSEDDFTDVTAILNGAPAAAPATPSGEEELPPWVQAQEAPVATLPQDEPEDPPMTAEQQARIDAAPPESRQAVERQIKNDVRSQKWYKFKLEKAQAEKERDFYRELALRGGQAPAQADPKNLRPANTPPLPIGRAPGDIDPATLPEFYALQQAEQALMASTEETFPANLTAKMQAQGRFTQAYYRAMNAAGQSELQQRIDGQEARARSAEAAQRLTETMVGNLVMPIPFREGYPMFLKMAEANPGLASLFPDGGTPESRWAIMHQIVAQANPNLHARRLHDVIQAENKRIQAKRQAAPVEGGGSTPLKASQPGGATSATESLLAWQEKR